MTKTMVGVLAVLALGLAGGILIGSLGSIAGESGTTGAHWGTIAVAEDTTAAGPAAKQVAAAMPRHDSRPSASGNLVVELCDGETAAEIPGVKEGETPTREQAQTVVDQLMAEWRRKNPTATWDDAPMRVAQAAAPGAAQQGSDAGAHAGANAGAPGQPAAGRPAGSPAPGAAIPAQGGAPDTASQREDADRKLTGSAAGQPNVAQPAPAPAGTAGPLNFPKTDSAADAPAAAAQGGKNTMTAGEAAASGSTAGGAGGLPAGPQGDLQSGHTYGAFAERDERIWQAETEKFVKEGHRVFHDAKAFGGTIGVSCDMCHPDAANTHPETYPKFQVQLGRVAILRDMINWCIQNPTRGKPLPDDDPRIKAMEAYIIAQRKGATLDFGKH